MDATRNRRKKKRLKQGRKTLKIKTGTKPKLPDPMARVMKEVRKYCVLKLPVPLNKRERRNITPWWMKIHIKRNGRVIRPK